MSREWLSALTVAAMSAPVAVRSMDRWPRPSGRSWNCCAADLPYNRKHDSRCLPQPQPMTNRSRTDSLLLAGFCAFLFLYGLGQFGLIGADEPRYAQVAREMFERHDWITPTLDGHAWLEKPPLYYWQAMLAFSVFGVS